MNSTTVSPNLAGAHRRAALIRRMSEALNGIALAIPAALLLLTTIIAPLIILLVLAFTDYELGSIEVNWIGFKNFEKALSDPVFRRSIINTLIYVGLMLPGGIIFGLLIALLVHSRKQSRSFYETIYFLPVTATLIAMAAVWQFVLHPRIGPVNAALKSIGFQEVGFLSSPSLVIPTLAFLGIWLVIGFNMVLFLAGLSAIPKDLYDAAEIDGAGRTLDRFVSVTWPMLAPTTMFVAVTTSITAFKIFDLVAVLTAGRDGTEVLLYAIYLEGFQYFRTGYAAALTVIFLLFMLAFSIIQALQLDRKVHYS